MRQWLLWGLCASLLGGGLVACGEDTEEDPQEQGPQEIQLQIQAMVGEQAFSCSESYEGLGRSGASTWTPRDFRFYVHNVRLLTQDGQEVPLELTQDGAWQVEDVVLLDYEDKTGSCENGTTQVNDTITGTAPAGDYTGVAFDVGVPFELNHADQAAAPSPLNLTGMFWSWQNGYKFMRIDGFTDGLPEGYNLHLGSTGCQGDVGAVTGCDNGNRPSVRLEGWTPGKPLVIDLAALVAGAALEEDLGGQPGCMSNPMDMDCPMIFDALGLNDATQTVFRVAP